MAKDTKKIVAQSVLNILSDGAILNLEEVTRRTGVTRQTIQKNFHSKGVDGVLEYLHLKIINEINESLHKHSADEIPLEIFADIVLKISWKYRDVWHTLYKSNLFLQGVAIATDAVYPWAKKRYERLVKLHKLAPIISPRDLLSLWHTYLFGVLAVWLNVKHPVEPSAFKPKFMYLMKNSAELLIYKDIGYREE